jgi:hypothetical protein
MSAENYCPRIWACMLGLLISDIMVLSFVYQKVSTVWIRAAAFMFGRFCLLCAVLHRSVRVRLGLIYPAEITLPRRQFYLGLLMPSS